MTIKDLRKHYEQTGNNRGVELLTKIIEQRTARLLLNEQDEAIRKDLMKCEEWHKINKLSYVDRLGHWVIISPPDSVYKELIIKNL